MSNESTQRPRKKKRAGASDTPDFFTVSKKATLGATAALCVALLLSAVSAALCLLSPDPATLTLPIGIATFLVSAAVGGAVSATGFKSHPTAAVVSALFCGFMLVILTGICALWQSTAATESTHSLPPLLSLAIRITAIPLSALSAYFVTKRLKKPRRRKR